MRLGSPESPHGAMYLLRDREDIIKMCAEVCETTFKLNGGTLTPQIKSRILAACRRKQDEADRRIDALGIPEKLGQLLEIRSKSKLWRYCSRLSISERELSTLGHNCSQIGFTHHFKFPIYVPQHLEVTDSDLSNLHNGESTDFMKKINARQYGEEKRILVDLFEKESQWHCFYNTYRDMQSDDNHWKYGSHIHYVSYLWPEYRKKQIWELFDKRVTKIAGSIHIRYEKLVYPPPNIPW